ncbi:LppM family (lipo)protein [Gordonia iterans]
MSSLARLPVAAVALLTLVPLLSGCLTRSENVGDQFSGSIVVAATPARSPSPPTFDIPASMSGSIAVTEFPGDGPARRGDDPESPAAGKNGSRMTFSNLTAGQFGQLGDIVSGALGNGATVDLSATRSGDIVRLRGGAALTGLTPQNDYLALTVDFGGPVVATNGERAGVNSVSWIPEPGQNADFNADAEYPDPATAALPSWTWFMVLLCLAVVALVGALAYRFRDRTPRYVAPRPDSGSPGPGLLGTRFFRRSGSAEGGSAEGRSAEGGSAEGGDDAESADGDSADRRQPARNRTD